MVWANRGFGDEDAKRQYVTPRGQRLQPTTPADTVVRAYPIQR